MVSMMAGADFIKTSTGKEAVNATLPVGLVMCRAIRHFYLKTGSKVRQIIIILKPFTCTYKTFVFVKFKISEKLSFYGITIFIHSLLYNYYSP